MAYVFTDLKPDIRITRYCTVTRASWQVPVWIASDGLASVSRMPARPHRTVDRVIQILETVSLSPRGVTLAELAAALDAAKSSVQELTNGLLARGYLIEEERRFHLGPGPFILAARANKLAALSLDHQFVAELAKVLGCTVLVGVRVGDAIVFTDFVGEESPSLTFVARTHARRPLYTSAAGKTSARQRPRRRDVPPPRPRRSRAGRRGTTIPRRAPRDPVPPTGLQPRSHARGRVCRGHAPAGTRRQSDRGDQCSRRRFRSGSSRRDRRRAQEGRRHSRARNTASNHPDRRHMAANAASLPATTGTRGWKVSGVEKAPETRESMRSSTFGK